MGVVTYLASHAKGLLAAFVANLPVITLITFLMIYFESGQKAVISYAKGLIIMLLPWLAYILSVIFLTGRFGLIASLVTGVSLKNAANFRLPNFLFPNLGVFSTIVIREKGLIF